MPTGVRAATMALFTLLIGDTRFKRGLALCTALCYPLIAAQHATRVTGPSTGIADTSSVFDLTVQYLNRENTVAALVEEGHAEERAEKAMCMLGFLHGLVTNSSYYGYMRIT